MKISIGIMSGVQVITEKGEKNIEYLKPGDKLLNSFNKHVAVKEVRSRIFRGELLMFNVRNHPSIQCDGEQMFYTIGDNGERCFVSAKDLKPKSDLCILYENNGKILNEWVQVKSITRVGSSCRYLYGVELEDGETFTANGYIVRNTK